MVFKENLGIGHLVASKTLKHVKQTNWLTLKTSRLHFFI
jgi:hypothetical protein